MSGPVPYLGSKISLISKSEIRYEGILYTIDAQESIIALAKVRSFGTEDRPVEIPVPARDEVYEYIIFRGTDIKKIEVCDTPKPAPLPVGLHNDPAIVQHSAPSVPTTYQPSMNRPLGPIGGSIGLNYASTGFEQPVINRQTMPGVFGMGSSQPSELSIGEASGGGVVDLGLSASGQHIPTPIGPPSHSMTQAHSHQEDVLTGSRSSTPLAARKSPVSDASVQVSPPKQQQVPQQEQQRQHSQDKKKSSPPQKPNQNQHERKFEREQKDSYSQNYNRENQNFNREQNYKRDPQNYRDSHMNQRRGQNQYNQGYRQNQQGGGGYQQGGSGGYQQGGSGGYQQGGSGGYQQGGSGGYQQGGSGGYQQGGSGGYQQQGGGGYQQGSGGYQQGSGGYQQGSGGYQQGSGGYQQGGYFQYQYGSGRGGGNIGGMGRGRSSRRAPQARGRGPVFNQGGRQRQDQQQIFDKEFDFEQANEEFEELRSQLAKTKISENGDSKKEDSGHETATTGDESEDSCYDKTKSFFDSISCEAIERSKGRSQRPDWRLERKINVQTFGVATARRGYFPRGGRGGYYRGGYYRNYNQGGYYRGQSSSYRGNRGGGGNRSVDNSRSHSNEISSGLNGMPETPAGSGSYASAVSNNAAQVSSAAK